MRNPKKVLKDMLKEKEDLHDRGVRVSYILAVCFATLILAANALFFGFIAWDGTPEGIYRNPYGISAVVDILLAALFIAGFAPFAFLKFVAFASAGFFAYWSYCTVGSIAWPTVVMWLLLGCMSTFMKPRYVAIVGVAAFCLSIISNFQIF